MSSCPTSTGLAGFVSKKPYITICLPHLWYLLCYLPPESCRNLVAFWLISFSFFFLPLPLALKHTIFFITSVYLCMNCSLWTTSLSLSCLYCTVLVSQIQHRCQLSWILFVNYKQILISILIKLLLFSIYLLSHLPIYCYSPLSRMCIPWE